MPSHNLILSFPLFLPKILPSIKVSSKKLGLDIFGVNVGASSLSSVLPLNIALPLKNNSHVSNHLTVLTIEKV